MYNDTNPYSGVGLVRKEMASLDQLLFTFDLIKYMHKGYHGIYIPEKQPYYPAVVQILEKKI